MKTTKYLCFLLSLSVMSGQEPARLCGTIVGLYQLEFRYEQPASQSARVEVRQCHEQAEALQIVAWSSRAGKPDLVIETSDFVVTASAFRSNVAVIETTGGSRDQVYVLVYEKGKPHLALRRSMKASALVTLSDGTLHLVIPGIYAGDAPPRTEEHDFKLSDVYTERP